MINFPQISMNVYLMALSSVTLTVLVVTVLILEGAINAHVAMDFNWMRTSSSVLVSGVYCSS